MQKTCDTLFISFFDSNVDLTFNIWNLIVDQQWDLSVWNADYKSSASYACQKSWRISSTEQ